MAEYQRIEYRIGKDGKIIETVLGASGLSCTTTTSGMEQALGQIESRKLLPEYYEGESDWTLEEIQQSNQQ